MVLVGKRGRQSALVPGFFAVAVALGLVALTSSWMGPGSSAGSSVELAQHPAGSASQSSMVAKMLKLSLEDDVNQQEGKLYEAALAKGGIHLNKMARKAVADEVTGVIHLPRTWGLSTIQ